MISDDPEPSSCCSPWSPHHAIRDAIEVIRKNVASIAEDWPGHRRMYFRDLVVRLVVELADSALMQASDGSCEETNYLTARVAEEFLRKVTGPTRSALLKYDMEQTKR